MLIMKHMYQFVFSFIVTSCVNQPELEHQINKNASKVNEFQERGLEQKTHYSANDKESAKLLLPDYLQELAPKCSSGYMCGPLDTKAIDALKGEDKTILINYLHTYYPEYGY